MFKFTEENKDLWLKNGADLLNNFGHETADKGMNTIWSEFASNKAPIGEILSKHPNWEQDVMAVHLTEEYSTSVDHDKVRDFYNFLLRRLRAWCKEREIVYGKCRLPELVDLEDKLRSTIDQATSISRNYQPVIIAGRTIEEMEKDLDRLQKLRRKYLFTTETVYDYAISNADYNLYQALCSVIHWVLYKTENTLDDYFAQILNDSATPFFPKDKNGEVIRKARFTAGMKTSKAITKFFSLLGDHFVKFRDIQVNTWVDQSGHVHERTKDMGWNHYFSAYGDAINPIKVKRHTYISINPLDYITMSFGNGWASCHTIDYDNVRPNNGEHSYSGCYMSGTLSYMMDGSSIIMYTTNEDIDASHPWEADKINRCVFNLGEEKFTQGRTYPDGRDNPNNEEAVTIASIFRNIFQRVISECLDVPNMWVIKRNNHDYTVTSGTHYKDYYHYEDTCTCLLKGSVNSNPIYIGHNPICPVCGKTHTRESSLHCMDNHECQSNGNYVECHRCGSIINRDVAIHDVDTDNYYCDSDCANNGECYFCYNVEEWHSDNIFYDEYDEEWFYDPDGFCIETLDGNYFQTEENAQAYGYIQDEDGDWIRREN